ncbi:MAG: squalene synthase HpnC [Acidobacteria bacterium]|nr:squalene synthase HpnC [Acidobacteriota bacterium]
MVDPQISAAYEHCERLARSHYENFPVASVLVPARMRRHIAAVYAFARTADDFADEPSRPPEVRRQLLDDWHARLRRSVSQPPPSTDPIFIALRDTMERCALPVDLFEDLLSAFRQDVTVTRYESWTDVLDYCRRSANPVGRLVLRIAGVRSDSADRSSDALCTALQLANFWQDFGVDWRNGRLYVPAEERQVHGAAEGDLDGAAMTPAWRSTMRAAVERTRRLFAEGRPVTDAVTGRLRWELRATWLGGMRILDKVKALDYDTLHSRPKLSASDAAGILFGVLTWRARSTSHST